MDNTIILYIIKVSVSISLLYGIYMLFLRKDTFNHFKRYYLLFAVFASVLFPICNIDISGWETTKGTLTEIILPQAVVIPENAGEITAISQTAEQTINLSKIILYLMIGGTVLFSLRFIIQLVSIIKIRLSHKVFLERNHKIIYMPEGTAPFSFFYWIFLPENVADQQDKDIMIAHEKVHSIQNHSADIIIGELFRAVFWWNPFSWLIRKEMHVNLEYLADEGVLQRGYEPRAYQYLLLNMTNSNASIQVVNYFNVSQLKKRIVMINQEKSRKILTAKYLLVLPVTFLMLLINIACSETDKAINENETVEAVAEPQVTEKVEVAELKEVPAPDVKEMKPFQSVEVMPLYPGGEDALLKYVRDNLKYPVKAIENKTEGRTVVRFVVSETGKIQNAEILRSLSPECDAEALRVVNSMPQWTPGKQKGENVPVYYTLPVRYKLPD